MSADGAHGSHFGAGDLDAVEQQCPPGQKSDGSARQVTRAWDLCMAAVAQGHADARSACRCCRHGCCLLLLLLQLHILSLRCPLLVSAIVTGTANITNIRLDAAEVLRASVAAKQQALAS